tara:strand:- start:430 stop:987 length:558 start_codon:yes stop_codon:yes gene_type:complete
MFVLVENDSITKTLNTSRGITIGENQYPRAIYTLWSTAEREAIGIYEVVVDNTNLKDQRYNINTNQSFTFVDGVATASYGNATAKDLADVTEDGITTPGLKTKHKEIIKKQASGLLTPTDWHVIKATEVESYSVSAEQTTYRAAVRTASNDMEALIDACNTVDELAALYVYTDGSRPLGEFPEAV